MGVKIPTIAYVILLLFLKSFFKMLIKQAIDKIIADKEIICHTINPVLGVNNSISFIYSY